MNMIPKERPKATKEEVLAFVKLYIDNKALTEDLFLVSVRGYYLNTMGQADKNDRGIYDDAMFIVSPTVFKSFNANNDPSVNRPGIATLIEGIHLYKKGDHNISKPWKRYPALRPATPDESLLATRDGSDKIVKAIATNIHKGSLYSTSSEGCQTIYPAQWLDFITTVYAEMDKHNQLTIPCILINIAK